MMGTEKLPAVTIRNAYKRYTLTSVVLEGLNMTIEQGTIYGLLGPSGCGKTTLLSCVVGRQSFDSGSLRIAYSSKNQIGYMPQEITLSNELTIEEALAFYGRLYMMNKSTIKSRTAELLEFLDLSDKNKIIGNCSGGQQRRISLAVALIHDPDFLILDEPTVGLDPVLCFRIWEFFIELVSARKKTIIITTHYIEEAKNSNRIGLLRGGILLAEDSPDNLIAKYECERLEEVFLKLSQEQEDEDIEMKPYPPATKPSPPFRSTEIFNWTRFKTQFDKNITWSYRNWAVTLFVCLVPTVTMYLCCANDIDSLVRGPIAVVVSDKLNCSAPMRQIRPCIKQKEFACRYISLLESRYPLEIFTDMDKAFQAGKKGHVCGLVDFHENFTDSLMERVELQAKASDKVVEESSAHVSLDMTVSAHAFIVINHIYTSFQNLLIEICSACNFDLRLTRIPVEKPIYGSFNNGKLVTSVLPGIICPFVFYTAFVYTSTALMMEKSTGLIERNQIAGLNIFEIIMAQSVVQLLIIFIQNFCLFSVLYLLYDNALLGSFTLIYIIILLCQALGITYGTLLALVMDEERMVSYAGIGTMLATFTYCGCLWPIEGQHWLIWYSGKLIPLTYASKAYFDVSVRGWGLESINVTLGLVWPIIGVMSLTGFTYLLFKLKKISV